MKQPSRQRPAPTSGNHREPELGRKLRKISEEYEAKGGKLLSREEVEHEIAERRGAPPVEKLQPMTPKEREAITNAARLFRDLGAAQVFLFGSAAKGKLTPHSDIDMAVSGLPPQVYFSAINQASDLLGRTVDLMDLDDDTPLVRYLRTSGDLVRVA